MDVVYRRGEASAVQVMNDLPDPPSYSATRTLIRILEDKGHLRHREEKGKYIYAPTRPREQAAKSALQRLLSTFFDNSAEQVVSALLTDSNATISDEELARIQRLIAKARKEGR